LTINVNESMQMKSNAAMFLSFMLSTAIPVTIGIVAATLFPGFTWSHYPFHSTVESIGALSAITIAILMLIMLNSNHLDRRFIVIAIAMIGMGLLDGFHSILHVNNSFVWLHSVATLVGGILFSLVWLSMRWLHMRLQKHLIYIVTGLSLSIGILSVAFPDYWPVMVENGSFTLAARIPNLIGGIGFLAGATYFILSYLGVLGGETKQGKFQDIVFANHCLLFGIAALLFEFSVLWDVGWWWWHILRLMAYMVVLVYMFSQFWESQQQLQESENSLGNMNAVLEQKVTERTAELEQASKSKSEFLSRMSHELRTPLNAILGLAQVMASDESICQKNQANVKEISNAGDHLLILINEILDLSKIEEGQLKLEMTAVPLRSVLDECIMVINPLVKSRRISLESNLSEYNNVFVEADYVRLKQVFLNLLSNAVKYNRENGNINVVCILEQDNVVRINIADTGYGMTDEQLNNLFTPFNRFGAEYGDAEGTGIGLVISKKLIELINGNITVESEPGKGSIFSVELKLTEASEVKDPPKKNSTQTLIAEDLATQIASDSKILIAEDNKANQFVLQQQLDLLGIHKVEFADNGEVALHKWRKSKYDLIISDISMPLMDGYKLAECIRRDEKEEHVPIIAITANAMQDDLKRCLGSGMDAFVSKPVKLDELRPLLQQYLPHTNHVKSQINKSAKVGGDNPVSISMLNSMIGGDRNKHRMLLKVFLQTTPEIIQVLRKAFIEHSSSDIEKQAHKLKSSARNIGANKLADTCQALESAGRKDQWDEIDCLVATLDDSYNDVVTFVEGYCEEKT